MRRIRIFGLGLMGAGLLSFGISAVASAVPLEFLGTLPNKFTDKGGEEIFGIGGTLMTFRCKEEASIGEITSAHGGTFKLDFNVCVDAFGNKYTTEGDAIGVILLAGTFSLVYYSLSPLKVALLLNVPTAVKLNPLGEVKGSLLAGISPINTKTKKFELILQQSEGVQSPSEYYNEKGEKITVAGPFGLTGHTIGWASSSNAMETEKEMEVMG